MIFSIGDKVLKRNHVLSSGRNKIAAKLAKTYVGPLTVTARVGSNTYMLKNASDEQEGPIAVEQLKAYVSGHSSDSETQGSSDEQPQKEATQPPRDAREVKANPPPASVMTGVSARSEANDLKIPATRCPERPRKTPEEPESANEVDAPPQKENETVSGMPTKRGRGRPRKTPQ